MDIQTVNQSDGSFHSPISENLKKWEFPYLCIQYMIKKKKKTTQPTGQTEPTFNTTFIKHEIFLFFHLHEDLDMASPLGVTTPWINTMPGVLPRGGLGLGICTLDCVAARTLEACEDKSTRVSTGESSLTLLTN